MRDPGAGLVALWARLLPSEVREALAGDLIEGLQGRAGWSARRRWRWLVGEVARTPYVVLWRQSGAAVRRDVARAGRRGPRDALGSELALASRSLIRRPGFSAVGIGTLALSVGAATGIFSLFEGVLLRPLPY